MTYKLILSERDVNMIARGLGKLPLEAAFDTYMELNKQIAEHASKKAKK